MCRIETKRRRMLGNLGPTPFYFKPDQPFGGIQLVFAGGSSLHSSHASHTRNATDAAADFYQLPAINGKFRLRDNAPTPLPTASAEPNLNVKKFIPIDVSEFCALAFVSHVWLEAKFECVELKKM